MKYLKLILPLFLLTSCSILDNYLLGKDNTPPPAELVAFKPTLKIRQLWQADAGIGTNGEFLEMSPVANEGAVYTADVGGLVMAFDRKTGDVLWEKDLNTHLLSGPRISNDFLAVTNKDAQLIVLDIHTGKKCWTRTVSNEIFSPPTLAEGKIFVKTVDGKLYAFDETDGKRLWRYDHGSTPLVMRAGSSPTALFGVVIAGFADSKLVGLKADTGQLLWEKPMSIPQGVSEVERMADIDADPIIMNGVVYVASYQQNVSAMSLQNGEFLWKKTDISTFNNMAADFKNLYVVNDKSTVWAITRDSGAILWEQTDLHNRRLTAPIVVPDKALVVGDFQGFTQWLSLEDGHLLARTRPSHSAIFVQPALYDNYVYILTSSGTLVAYEVP